MKARDICKIEVKRHQAALLSNTYLEKPNVACALQCFLLVTPKCAFP